MTKFPVQHQVQRKRNVTVIKIIDGSTIKQIRRKIMTKRMCFLILMKVQNYTTMSVLSKTLMWRYWGRMNCLCTKRFWCQRLKMSHVPLYKKMITSLLLIKVEFTLRLLFQILRTLMLMKYMIMDYTVP